MERKTLRAIITDETLDESAKISKILQSHHDEVADVKSGLKSDDEVKAAVAEALKNAPKQGKVVESDEYKKLKQDFDDYKYKTELTSTLKGAKVKDKFLDDVISKIARDGKVDEQLPKIKETYTEYFDDADPTQTPPNKPVFSGDPKPTPPPTEKKPIPKLF